MKAFSTIFIFTLFVLGNVQTVKSGETIIVDHNSCSLEKVPLLWISNAKSNLKVAYGHTSHGSQLITGMNLLKDIQNSVYQFNNGTGSLYINDASVLGGDLGNPDRTTWAQRTRNLLTNNTGNYNVIMWSWCGQVDGSESDINTYLTLMNGLEEEFPNVKFVYMTGHLNGTGENGNVNKRNEQIRKYCRENGKILFDFADIESYDPGGAYFLDKNADDGCNYSGGNWAKEWCSAHPNDCPGDCSCAHSECLNCRQKGKAAWWLFARLSGWDGQALSVGEETNNANLESAMIGSICYISSPMPSMKPTKIDVLSYSGEIIASDISYKSEGNKLLIDMDLLASGVYFVSVFDGSHTYLAKVAFVKP